MIRDLLSSPRVPDRSWVAWNHAFSLLQLKKADDARAELSGLTKSVTDPVLLLLVLYLLDVCAKSDAALESKIAAMRDALRDRHTPASFQKAIEKSGGNLQVVVLARLLQDAVGWLFAGSPAHAPAVAP